MGACGSEFHPCPGAVRPLPLRFINVRTFFEQGRGPHRRIFYILVNVQHRHGSRLHSSYIHSHSCIVTALMIASIDHSSLEPVPTYCTPRSKLVFNINPTAPPQPDSPKLLPLWSKMCDYTQIEFRCHHRRFTVRSWCVKYQETHKRCPANVVAM